jgi:hypothetical protein
MRHVRTKVATGTKMGGGVAISWSKTEERSRASEAVEGHTPNHGDVGATTRTPMGAKRGMDTAVARAK